MSSRTRVLLGSVFLVWIPILAVVMVIRTEMNRRLTAEHDRRVETLLGVVETDLWHRTDAVRKSIDGLRTEILEDNRFRLATGGIPTERGYLLDYAERAMGLLGLSMLQIQDSQGRILSSGHFRNDFDRLEPELPAAIARSNTNYALVHSRTPAGRMLALASVDSLRLGSNLFTLVGGVAVEDVLLAFAAPDSNMALSLLYPGGAISSDPRLGFRLSRGWQREGWTWEEAFPGSDYVTRPMPVAYVSDQGAPGQGTLIASYSLLPQREILRSLDIWLGGVLLVAVLGTLILMLWASRRMTRPLEELAERTTGVDLDRLDTLFPTGRSDEIGDLSRFLNSMIRRLRTRVHELRDAERRAAQGELARQINHDVKNGLLPIRNVFRHLREVAKDDPEQLSAVFEERQGVLDSSIGYLESLAENYSKLYQPNPRQSCDLNAVVEAVASSRSGGGKIEYEVRLESSRSQILADPVALRRIVDNLVTNAEESLPETGGKVTLVTADRRDEGGLRTVSLTVADTGSGSPPEIQKKIFDDFFTTKSTGAGLGLSIVRRMVADSSGSIRVQSETGRGTRFIVEWPESGSATTGGGDPP